jgi:hypothetical protein
MLRLDFQTENSTTSFSRLGSLFNVPAFSKYLQGHFLPDAGTAIIELAQRIVNISPSNQKTTETSSSAISICSDRFRSAIRAHSRRT